MPRDKNDEARSIANSSGFPLQIKIAHDSNLPKQGHVGGWRTHLEEHRWHSNETGSWGFIDLIVSSTPDSTALPSYYMVIECKRVRDSTYVFLLPDKNKNLRSHAKIWCSYFANSKWKYFDWKNCQFDPSTYESKFCAIPGQESGRNTILEKTAFNLIESAEALAWQEKRCMGHDESYTDPFIRFYIPVIVTTAKLAVAHFDPSLISAEEGTLPNDFSFESVKYIRFFKSLSSPSRSPKVTTISEAHEASERTVFVVNSEHWISFLRSWEMQG